MTSNPKIYEINVRLWLRVGKNLKYFIDNPDYFLTLASKGINAVWLMGLWKTPSSIVKKCCFTPELVSSYSKALKDWKDEDVIGSPYSIDCYEINPALGTKAELAELKKILNDAGLSLIVDFIPNHFSADSNLIMSHPEYFLQADEDTFKKDPFTFFKAPSGKIFAHGRDPLFPPWMDTVQVNFFNPETRNYFVSILKSLITISDGVRCDMAMLPLNNVFFNTWVGLLNKLNIKKPQEEFWKEIISKVKEEFPEFIFLGEAYWGLEWDLQQLGFDFTYDKRLTDRIAGNDIEGTIAHLKADNEFQRKSVRFVENHDEQRAVSKFGKIKSLAAATIITTVQGMKLYFEGQFEGKKIKLPVQLGREPEEKTSRTVSGYYELLLNITKDKIFHEGEWQLLIPSTAGGENYSCNNFFAWLWNMSNEYRMIVVNYSENTSQCRIKLNFEPQELKVDLTDLLTGHKYHRSTAELKDPGLFVELKGFNSHIFSFTL